LFTPIYYEHGDNVLKIYGHRANTARIIRYYLRTGIKAFEVDLTLDEGKDKIVLRHGPSPIRRPSIPGRIMAWIDYHFFYRDPLLKKISFEEILELAVRKGIDLLLDIKDLRTAEKLVEVLSTINTRGIELALSSEDHRAIKYVSNKMDKGIFLVSLSVRPVDVPSIVSAASANGISIKYTLLTRDLIRELKDKGYIVYAWTVNDVKGLYKMIELGVDAVISDCPDKLVKALQNIIRDHM